MFRVLFYRGLVAGILSAAACLIYNHIYVFALETNFTRLVNPGSIIGLNLLSCLLAACGYWSLRRWLKNKAEIVFNFSFSLLSFASIIVPLSIKLPLDILQPELFLGITIPMHFFPALAWFTIGPIFREEPRASAS
jgi:hypothetical protein